eukprot:2836921-Rhodomonas_salina.4
MFLGAYSYAIAASVNYCHPDMPCPVLTVRMTLPGCDAPGAFDGGSCTQKGDGQGASAAIVVGSSHRCCWQRCLCQRNC